ncbi:hypothetical protein ACJVTN_17225 [Enterobacter hormaechei subsp. xiangfangensis]|uniref:hypothetical protein n=1 Tax=Enterobacter cloacae complex TaxID=354276 RepID=UPI00080A8C5F|nr:hypothetical protein [Enterobacter hormaechei]MCM7435413.1 hypothetical protein [Enterobacter hormaechei]MCM7442940.1 hypothetical protein [Enterobacter hormaechei]MCO7377827.1 hypothetical protein [Enterobacter hormaechei]MCS0509361.1 hypothetical protein [Enterobacter hormaechei]MDL4475892.1 hypothetical protein [Enterobacter hormaechei]
MLQRDPHGFRKDVKEFITLIKSFQTDTRTENNLTSAYKHVLFLEFIHNSNPELSHKTFIKSIIYDVLSSITAILHKRERYLHLNFRSMIEHLARISLQKVDNGGDFDITVRTVDFENLKSTNTDENWAYMHSQYKQACGWLHSSSKVKLNITASFPDLLTSDSKSNAAKLSTHLQKMTTETLKIFFNYYVVEIQTSFYRTRGEMRYVVGNHNFEYFLTKNQ